MRFDLLIALFAAAGAATLEPNTARPGGAYDTLPLASAEACASACAADALCMAWTYTPAHLCELKAVAPRPAPLQGAVSGLSERAPAFTRLTAPPTAGKSQPQNMAEAPVALRARLPAENPPAEDASGLLGGPQS
ncbi:MAG: PAN domain-containing protein [Hyphomonadaceae bacterium]